MHLLNKEIEGEDMLKKILIIVSILIIVLIVVAVIGIKIISPDQVKIQYKKEMISEHKRELDFSMYDLDAFSNRYMEMKSLVVEQSIEQLQNSLLEGDFSCEELAKFYLYRIREYESYNTVIELNPYIIEEAIRLDEKIKNGEVDSLYGVMVLIKDNIADKSMHTSTGAYVLKDLTTDRDAHLVTQLKQQDALILGKANLSEWSNFLSMPSSNGFSALGGQTKNAYGLFDVGGSSSGSSSGASLNLATVTIGSETSGSLIYPAGQNSVVALKPTLGLISRDLIVPIAEAQDTAGVIGKSVRDVYTVFSNMIAFDEADEATSIVTELSTEDQFGQSTVKRIGVVNSGSKEMKDIILEFQGFGIEVVDVKLGDQNGIDMMSVLEYGIVHDVEDFLMNEAVNSTFNTLEEIVEFNNNNKSAIPYNQYLLESALKSEKTKSEIESIILKNQSISRDVIDGAMEQYNVQILLSISNELSGVYAPAGYPAVTIPAGYRENGEPYGITLVGSYLSDIELLEMALLYENETKHRRLPNR